MPVIGYWKITDMEVWDHDYVDLVVPGFIEFDNADGEHITGGFQFGTVSGGLHAHVREIGSEPFIEATASCQPWPQSAQDETHEALGASRRFRLKPIRFDPAFRCAFCIASNFAVPISSIA